MKYIVSTILIAILLSGCAEKIQSTEIKKYDKPKEIILEDNFDNVWNALTYALSDKNIDTKVINKELGLITSEYNLMKGLFPIWIPRADIQKFEIWDRPSYAHSISRSNSYSPPLDPYLSSGKCSGGLISYNGEWVDSDPSTKWLKNSLINVPEVQAQISFKVEWINKKQTKIKTKIKTKVPVICANAGYNGGISYTLFGTNRENCYDYYSDTDSDLCSLEPKYIEKVRVPHINPLLSNILEGMKKYTKAKNDYKRPGSIKLNTQTTVQTKETREKASLNTKSIEERFNKLNSIYKKGFISKKEYEVKKKSLLNEL